MGIDFEPGRVRKGFVKGAGVSPEHSAGFWYKALKALSGGRGMGTAGPQVHGSLRHSGY